MLSHIRLLPEARIIRCANGSRRSRKHYELDQTHHLHTAVSAATFYRESAFLRRDRRLRVGCAQWRLAVFGKRNLTDRFPAMNPKGRRSRRDPYPPHGLLQSGRRVRCRISEVRFHLGYRSRLSRLTRTEMDEILPKTPLKFLSLSSAHLKNGHRCRVSRIVRLQHRDSGESG